MTVNCRPVLRIAVCSALILAGSRAATAADLSQQVSAMLDHAWKPSPTGLKKAGEQFLELKDQHPTDIRVKYGYSLLLIRNRKYDEAIKLLTELLTLRSNCLPARQARLWARLLNDEYDAALIDMGAMLDAMPADQNTPAEAQWQELSVFLGRVVGFLVGPAEMPDHKLEKVRTKVATTLVGPRLVAFTDAEQQVAQKFVEFGQTQQATKAADQEKATEKKVEQGAEVVEGKQKVAADKASIDAEAQRLIAAQERDIQQLVSQAQKVQQSLLAAQAQINQWSNVFANAQNNLADLRAARNDKDSRRVVYGNERDLEARLNEATVKLNQARGWAAQCTNQLQQLEQTRLNTLANYTRHRQRLEKQARGVLREERRLETVEKSIADPIPQSTARTRAVATIATTITSYEELPYDRMRQQLLDSFKATK